MKTQRKIVLHTFISIALGLSLLSCDGKGGKKPVEVEKIGNPELQNELPEIPVAAMAKVCSPAFNQNVLKFNNYPDGKKKDCDDHKYEVSVLCADVYYAIYPGSAWETKKGVAALKAELIRVRDWYATYCIYIKFIPVPITDAKLRAQLAAEYNSWVKENPNQIISSKAGRDYETKIVAGIYREVAKTSNKNLAILCFDRHYLFASSGNSSRITPGSGTYTPAQIIGLDSVEIRSTHILSHELIHAFGKPLSGGFGPHSWFHNSICTDAMSAVSRTDPRLPFTKASSDKLDYAEYVDFLNSKQLKRCK